MTEWLLITFVLLVCSTIYCSQKMVADFRRTKLAGIWGLVALAGTISALAIGLTVLLISAYYH